MGLLKFAYACLANLFLLLQGEFSNYYKDCTCHTCGGFTCVLSLRALGLRELAWQEGKEEAVVGLSGFQMQMGRKPCVNQTYHWPQLHLQLQGHGPDWPRPAQTSPGVAQWGQRVEKERLKGGVNAHSYREHWFFNMDQKKCQVTFDCKDISKQPSYILV